MTMRKYLFSALQACLLIFLCALPAAAEKISCAECGMTVDPGSKFTSRIVQGEKTLSFCDIGDLFSYLARKRPQNVRAMVKDYKTGEWIDARQAFYVHAGEKFISPMGWGIAAFKDRKDAAGQGSVMDFDGALKSVQ
jgi:nitrous oxide reductase accessory protein NosL